MPWNLRRHRRRPRWAIAIGLTIAMVVADPSAAQASHVATVTVMTRNLYLGGDLTPSISAPTLPAFLAANATLLSHVDLVDFPARARLLAQEISDRRPDLVALQEVAMWRTGRLGDPAPATEVRYDHLALLRQELFRSGQVYRVAVVQSEADLEAPAGAPYQVDVRLTMRDVILVRGASPWRVTARYGDSFRNNVAFSIPATGDTVVSTRGWVAVDVMHRRRRLRFVNTHLEAFHAGIRVQQAQELLAGPLAGGPDDMILAGDLNSGPELPEPDNRLAYFALVAGGLRDTWPLLHPGESGFTASLGDDLTEPANDLEHRVDMVMVHGRVAALSSALFGNQRRTPEGRWPSDHLGHAATLVVPRASRPTRGSA